LNTLIGKRIKLIHTADIFTKLKPGDMGTITDVSTLPESFGGGEQVWIRWDNKSMLALISGKDSFEINPNE
jgi:hypothetical protein